MRLNVMSRMTEELKYSNKSAALSTNILLMQMYVALETIRPEGGVGTVRYIKEDTVTAPSTVRVQGLRAKIDDFRKQ